MTVGSPLSSGANLRRVTAPTLAVSARFSGSASDTIVIWPVFYVSTDASSSSDGDTDGTYTFIGEGDRRTVTASASTDTNSDNVGPTETWDTYGATHYEVRVEAPSTGNVDLHAWEY